MWGRYYWGRKREKGGETETVGIVVVFAWLSSQERHLKPYLDLYFSLGWSSLVCHSEFLTLFFPERAASLADGVIKEIVKELKIKPLPVVFASFSGGPKGCTYKVFQLIERKCEGQLSLEEYRLVKNCVCGQIFDSSPVDFKSDLGTRFVLHPTVLKMSQPPLILSWIAKSFASGLDFMFLSRFEEQRSEFWQTLYASANAGPILIFCSENDELAPFTIINNFANKLQEQGAQVNLIKWDSSPHVGHYRYYPDEYMTHVTDLLAKASTLYFNRNLLNYDRTGTADLSKGLPKSIHKFCKTAADSNTSLSMYIDPTDQDQFLLPSSMEYNEESKCELLQSQSLHNSVYSNGVLGRILFDVCVPKNIEGWDLRPNGPLNAPRNHSFNPIKCIRRSRL